MSAHPIERKPLSSHPHVGATQRVARALPRRPPDPFITVIARSSSDEAISQIRQEIAALRQTSLAMTKGAEEFALLRMTKMEYAPTMTPAREKKFKSVIEKRQKTLAVVLENVDDPHNIGAILRSCDALGIYDVHLLYTNNRPPRLREMRSKSAASATKWLHLTKWTSVTALVAHLKKTGFALAVTKLGARAKDISKTDLTVPVAIAIGNEHAGVSKELADAADMNLKIPMQGFVQSFNVSVAAAIALYEATRQRAHKKGDYGFTKKEQEKLFRDWSRSPSSKRRG